MKLHDPYDPDVPLMMHCACGKQHGGGAGSAPDCSSSHKPAAGFGALLGAPSGASSPRTAPPSMDEYVGNLLEASFIKSLFPRDAVRREFMRRMGRSAAKAAIASVLPLGALQAMALERKPPEKRDVKIGFIAITCATPLLMAEPLGFYKDQQLNVTLVKTPGWGAIRDRVLNKEHDASHFLSPMPLAMSLGLGNAASQTQIATIQNINGQAITLANKHKTRRDP